MASDNDAVKLKGAKPPPPVPPRPSKKLIKEALAKTREAHEVSLTRAPRINDREKPSPRQSPEHNGTNNNTSISGKHQLYSHQPRNCNIRPVIYQSKNCKSSLIGLENTKSSEREINRTKSNKSIETANESVTDHFATSAKLRRCSDVKIDRGSENRGELMMTKIDTLNTTEDLEKTDDISDGKFDTRYNETDTCTRNNRDVSPVITNGSASPPCSQNDQNHDKHWDEILNNRNHVNTLIDEMFASVLEVNLSNSTTPASSTESIVKDSDNKITISNSNNNSKHSEDDNLTVIVVNDTPSETKSCDKRKVKFNDRHNHEYLINELQNMNNHEETQYPSALYPDDGTISSDSSDKIHMNDWYGVNEGKKVRLSSCHIKIDDSSGGNERINPGYYKMKNMMREYDLPPLPKSLSGFKFLDPTRTPERRDSIRNNKESAFEFINADENANEEIPNKQLTNLDRQLAILRREMDILRAQDLSLLSKLWFLNESIQDFRQILQDQEEKNNFILSPSPTPSSVDDDEFYVISTSTC